MERRKHYLVDRPVQFSFLKFVVGILVVVCIFFSFFLLRVNSYLTDYLIVAINDGTPQIAQAVSTQTLKELKRELASKDIRFLVSIILSILILGLLVSFWLIRFTNRFAGPVYRIRKVLEGAVQGEYSTRIHLRQKDHLKDLAKTVNELLDSLEKKQS